jgi:hypothetical protein
LYKFIWNKHYLAAKAPERIKREIANKPLSLGGLGMLDIAKLDESIKLKSLGRLMSSQHYFMRIVRLGLDMSDYFFPKSSIMSDSYTTRALHILKEDRYRSLTSEAYERDLTYIGLVKSIKLKNVMSQRGKNSLLYFNLLRNDKKLVGDLSRLEIGTIGRFIKGEILNRLTHATTINYWRRPMPGDLITLPCRDRLIPLDATSSRDIRKLRDNSEPICVFKCGLILTPNECLNYMDKLKKLTSVAHRNSVLRALHGDIFVNERLFRFGLKNEPFCERCGEIDTLHHRLEDCRKVISLLEELGTITNPLGNTIQRQNSDGLGKLFANFRDLDLTTLTLHAETLRVICSNSNIDNPRNTIKRIIDKIFIMEKSDGIKNDLQDLKREYGF